MTTVTPIPVQPIIYHVQSSSGIIHNVKGAHMIEITPEMARLQQNGIKVVVEMIELQLSEAERLLIDPISNRAHLIQAGSMFLDIANIALSFGMDGTIARKLEDVSTSLTYILSSEAMLREFKQAREQLSYVLEPYKTLPQERTV